MTHPDDAIRIGNRYRLDERIGEGAMGAVWRATDELLDRTVAVKELLAAAAPRTPEGGDALEESRQRILREGRIGARLQHAHVISMFDVVVHDDKPWLVMEYLPSKSLASVLAEKGPLSPAVVADIGRQVADGLAAAHVAGVVHRDVKPGNVLIGEDGNRVKLSDFGVSKAVDDVQLTRTGLIAGTPAFLSPEVARGQNPTGASDVFSLGATLYAAVEGRPPFGLDDNPYALLHKVATGEVEPPEHAGRLEPLIMWLLSADPADRPSATQARDALEAVATGANPDVPSTTMLEVVPAAPGRGPSTLPEMPLASPPGPTRSAPVPAGSDGAGPDRADSGRDGSRGSGSGRNGAARAGSGGAAGRAGSGSGREPDPRRRRGLLAALAVLVLLVIGGVAAVLLGNAGGGTAPVQAAPPPASVEASPTAAPETAPAAAPVTEPSASAEDTTETTETSVTPAPAAPAGDPVAFVQDYYALLPRNTDAAFALLSRSAQAASGGRAGFDRFYGALESVSVRNARLTGADTVDALVVFVRRDGTSSSEPYRFVMATGDDGRTIMQSFSQA